METYQFILYSVEGAIATATLNRPEKRNAMNTQVYQELNHALRAALDDSQVRVVVLTGAGTVFCAGQDLKFTLEQSPEEYARYERINLETRELVRTMDKPVVARVNGDALGGGCYLATACDIVIAASHARFAMREILAGLHSGGAHLFTIGRARALEMNLTGRFVTAEEAERWGLINRVVPAQELDDAVREMAELLAARPPLGMKYTKRATNLLLEMAGYDALYRYIEETGHILDQTQDRKEAQRSFLEKRKPEFKGR